MVRVSHQHQEVVNRLHDRNLGPVIIVIKQEAARLGPVGLRFRPGGLDQFQRLKFRERQGIRVRFGHRQFTELLFGEPRLPHQLQQRDGLRTVGTRGRAARQHQDPVRPPIILRPGFSAIPNVQDGLEVLLVSGFAGRDIRPDHPREVVPGLPQLVRQQEGAVPEVVRRFDPFLGKRVEDEDGRKQHDQADRRQDVDRESGGMFVVAHNHSFFSTAGTRSNSLDLLRK